MRARPAISPQRSEILECRAWQMRHHMTRGEATLWSCLRAGQLGVRFRRQVPVASRYIVDFLAPSKKLIVEVDGAYHVQRAAADARRDRVLVRLGYRVLHIEDALVLGALPDAVARVRAALGSPACDAKSAFERGARESPHL
jgi:very-short-patch-repair endonuclease